MDTKTSYFALQLFNNNNNNINKYIYIYIMSLCLLNMQERYKEIVNMC